MLISWAICALNRFSYTAYPLKRSHVMIFNRIRQIPKIGIKMYHALYMVFHTNALHVKTIEIFNCFRLDKNWSEKCYCTICGPFSEAFCNRFSMRVEQYINLTIIPFIDNIAN